MTVSEAIMVALIAGVASIGGAGVGAYFSNRKWAAVMEFRLKATAIQEEKIKVANHRIDDLEKQAGHFAPH